MLKQERMKPLSCLFQLAWLTAFNEALFDQAEPREIAEWLAKIENGIAETELTLDSSPEQWRQAVRQWLNPDGRRQA
jgi:F-type H+-transporting ATPase subunit alpha